MYTCTDIMVIARPGHFRESLAALLMTIPQCKLFLVDGASCLDLDTPQSASPQVILLELGALDPAPGGTLAGLRRRWPGVRCILLADHPRAASAARALGGDLVLTQDVSAGALLRAVRPDRLARRLPLKSYVSI